VITRCTRSSGPSRRRAWARRVAAWKQCGTSLASGGAGELDDFAEIVVEADADAVLAASVFHFGQFSIKQVKESMAAHGVPVRL